MARLARGRRRLRFVKVFGVVALLGAAVLAVAAWFADWQMVVIAAGCVVAAAVAVAGSAAALVPVDPVVVAKHYDDRIGAQDLVSSTLEFAGSDGSFVAAVREDAVLATGKATASELYPLRATREIRWLPLPLAAAALAVIIDVSNTPTLPPASPELGPVKLAAADALDNLLQRHLQDVPGLLDDKQLERIKSLADRLRDIDLDKRQSLAELARLASQLDKERRRLESERLEVEKNAAKLARGEDVADARRDMDAGRYREAAQKIKKKIEQLREQLEEAQKRKQGKLEIEQLKKQIAKLKTLLAELEQLQALGNDLGFLVEVLEALERIEGKLGELGEYDGDLFEQAQLGRLRRPERARPVDAKQLLVMPGNEAGKGHVEKFLGESKRSLTESQEREAQLRESKGKSAFGQVRTANDGSRSRRAYDEAFLAAKRAAEDAVYRQNIPAGYRKFIRRYFEIMQPDRAAADPPGDGGK